MKNVLGIIVVMTIVSSSAASVKPLSVADSLALAKTLDSIGISKMDLEAKVQSTLLFGGSAPVSFSGEAKFKLQYHQFADNPKLMDQDKSWLQSNWEGNESALRLGMVVRAGRNTVLWSKIGFQHTMPGNYIAAVAYDPKTGTYTPASRHHKDGSSVIIHEDMNAGIAIRTIPASFWLKLGAVNWVQASPLTIWKNQPRTFAWEYLPFEVEQPIARFYEYNIAKGEKSGRAAWNKKAFQGINLESIKLPGGLYFNLLYATYERYDDFEREYYDFSGDYGLANQSGDLKAMGIGDSYRHLFHVRLAANELFGTITPALNFLSFSYDDNILKNSGTTSFQRVFNFRNNPSDPRSPGSRMFYKEPIVASVDLQGNISDKLKIHSDLAFSTIDTTWVKYDTVSVNHDSGSTVKLGQTQWNNRSPLKGALYSRVENKYFLPLNADLAIISKGFYSPLSFAPPVDAFFPFGTNIIGPGKFLARGEASPYTQNMAGINLQFAPALWGYGHFRVSYGQHFQLEAARDLIYFPYRLNGVDLSSTFQSSYNRWGNNPIDVSLAAKYQRRLGDMSFRNASYSSPLGFEGGGLFSDYLSIFEGFVAYENIEDAKANAANFDNATIFGSKSKDGLFRYTNDSGDTLTSANAFVPAHRKFTFNFDVDWGYDFGQILGYSNDLFLNAYFSLNGISTVFKPLAFNDDSEEMLLFGTYLRVEPAIALTKKFYILGLVGYENWRSQKTYMQMESKEIVKMPIDYRDYAAGLGFDWDMLSRVGLHGRVKYMWHDDINFRENCYKTPVISTEIKMWF